MDPSNGIRRRRRNQRNRKPAASSAAGTIHPSASSPSSSPSPSPSASSSSSSAKPTAGRARQQKELPPPKPTAYRQTYYTHPELVVHVRHCEFDVYTGRPNPSVPHTTTFEWGNPYKVGPDGDRNECSLKYQAWLFSQPELVAKARRELRGKVLACWCAPLDCHSMVLSHVANTTCPISELVALRSEVATPQTKMRTSPAPLCAGAGERKSDIRSKVKTPGSAAVGSSAVTGSSTTTRSSSAAGGGGGGGSTRSTSPSTASSSSLAPATGLAGQPMPFSEESLKLHGISTAVHPRATACVSPQPFRYYCVLDFEAVWDERGEAAVAEIIEFPSVLLNAHTLAVEDEFHSYVRPELQQLNPVCVSNTGIQQAWVDRAPLFAAVYLAHCEWLRVRGIAEEEVCVVTCGDWDLKHMLPRQLRRHSEKHARASGSSGSPRALPYPAHMRRWINIKLPFCAHHKQRRQQGMAGMLSRAGIQLTGRHHSGLDDCRNITKLLISLLLEGIPLDVTSKL